jgi:hypothetical protein
VIEARVQHVGAVRELLLPAGRLPVGLPVHRSFGRVAPRDKGEQRLSERESRVSASAG